MNGWIAWMARNHVAANLLMMIFIVGGVVMGFQVKQEVFPEIELDWISTTVVYPGASPDEVEEGIVLQIEEAIGSVDGIEEIKSVAAEGAGTLALTVPARTPTWSSRISRTRWTGSPPFPAKPRNRSSPSSLIDGK